jgi:hypothetical protein
MKINTFFAGFLAGAMFHYYYIAFSMSYYRIYQIPLFVLGLFAILSNLYDGKENKPQLGANIQEEDYQNWRKQIEWEIKCQRAILILTILIALLVVGGIIKYLYF